ncbi:metal-dependent hydrolase [Effusibacillus lacus]|uniref:Hydrolase n=1 Tax=Effusibacillus lacus TaxID=1348429 RepID=A0A292YPJ5_9BACL|nr:metal-dependent hydrolase [Effusibacillus lacus]TCS70066.1 inner membrane protein [Effusibacillus lacus]GAX91096.1 hydrolase [Effusibacillus lacus]
MDTITHTWFGLTIYGALNKEEMDARLKKAMFATSLVGSQIPDIDVISRYWDTEGMYQMWHRGLTHSVFLVPVWALLIAGLCFLLFRTRDRRIFWVGLLAVFIHVTSDLFNAWGTGYLEPFSDVRITFGTVPIVDLTVWTIILAGFVLARLRKFKPHLVYKTVGILIAAHFLIQSVQGYMIYKSVQGRYDEQTLAASFVPWNFQLIGKKGDKVEILAATVWSEPRLVHQLTSRESADLNLLFAENPKAKTLYRWAPFVVVVDNEQKLGIFDPRFYRDGESFLFEYIEKRGGMPETGSPKS